MSEDKTKTDNAADQELSDEEALAMLEGLDGIESTDTGVSEALEEALEEAPEKSPAEQDSQADSSGSMSDDEALALLAAMDEPSGASNAEVNTPDHSPSDVTQDALSADDEAMRMLADLGGMDEKEEAEYQSQSTGASELAETLGESIAEIPEWTDNDFRSDTEMMADFLSNADDLMETLDGAILQLEQDPSNKETIEEIFRAAHTFKGAAGMFGMSAMERVMHRMENLFDLIRKGKMVPSSDIVDVVFQGIDVLKTLLEAVRDNKPSGIKTAPIVTALTLLAEGKSAAGVLGGSSSKSTPENDGGMPSQSESSGTPPSSDDSPKGDSRKKEQQSTIKVDLARLDALVNLVGELVIDRTRFANIEEHLRTQSPQKWVTGSMTETVQLFGRHMNEIQDIIMKVRMVPIGNAFNKFTRIVRDLSRSLGKKIDLYIEGEETELDKTLVEQIGDPLIHLIRNSCDHGVEDPATRESRGKNATGHIILSARQEGNHILITIEDDGKGMPVDIIRRKGIERGLISEDDALPDRDIFNLIFEPGFSTAEKVTNVSGRGVGMDVVKKQISKLKGIIDIESKEGKGTTITIQLPLTLAIVQSLLVESRNEILAIPLSSVVESIRITPKEIQRVGDSEVIKLRDRVLPLLYLEEALDLCSKDENFWYSLPEREGNTKIKEKIKFRRQERLFVVVVGSAERRFGLVVDQLLNQQEMVIKTMGPLMKNIPCVAGGSVLGNGEVVLVLDVVEIESHFRSKIRVQSNAA